MIRLVFVDMDRALGTRDGRPLAGGQLDLLKRLVAAGVRVAPMSQRGPADALVLLGGERALLRDAVMENGARAYCDGHLLSGAGGRSRLEGATALMEAAGLGPSEVCVLGASGADAELLAALPLSAAPEDAPAQVREAAKALVPGLAAGGLAVFCSSVEDAANWGETPSLFDRPGEGAGPRAEFGGDETDATGTRRGLVPLVLGLLALACAGVTYLSGLLVNMAGMIALCVLLLAGVGLIYLGLGQMRDRRKARKRARKGARHGLR